MTKFKNDVYKKIIEYLWLQSKKFVSKSDKKFVLSLARVSWYFHCVVCSLNCEFSGPYQLIDQLLKFHIGKKYSVYSNLHSLDCLIGSLRDVNPALVKAQAASLRELHCGHADLDMMIRAGMNSLQRFSCHVSCTYEDEYQDIARLLPTLKQLRIGIIRDDMFDDDDGYDFNDFDDDSDNAAKIGEFLPIQQFLFSAPFHELTHLELMDSTDDPNGCNYGYFVADDTYAPVFFSGLAKMVALEHFSLQIKIYPDTLNSFSKFNLLLVGYLKTQRTLKSFEFTEEVPPEFGYLDFLFQESAIEKLSIECGASCPVVTRNNLQRLRLGKVYSNFPIQNLAMVRKLSLPNSRASFGEISKLINRQQQNLQEKTGAADKILKCFVSITDSNLIPPEFLESLKQSRSLRRIYLDFALIRQANKKPDHKFVQPIKDIILHHPTIRNKDTWWVSQ